MRPGFYRSSKKPDPKPAEPAVEAGKAAGPQTSTQQALPLTPDQWSQNFNSCLELLAGPTDEKRFVGLLLAVRLLPQGGDAAIHKVIDALGWRFITRLLLPLSPSTAAALPSAPGTTSASQQQQVELTCGLGLSILSAACRLPDLAASPQVASLVPMLVGVAVQGGVGPRLGLRPCAASPPLTTVTAAATTAAAAAAAAAGAAQSKLGQTSPPAAADAAGQAADAAAVSEALESLVAIGYAAGLEGRAVLLEGGALAAGCAELERVAWAGRQGKVQQREQVLERGVGSVWHRGVLAARLVGLLLGGEQQGQPGMQEHEEVLCAAVPALGHVLGMPTIVANKLHLDQQQQQRQQQHQQHQQQLGASESEPQGRTDTDGTPPRASSTPAPGASAAEGAGDGAMLQLECLHTLLLLLTPALHLERVRRHLAASAYPEAQPSSPGHLRDQSQGKGPCRHASPTTGQQQEQRGWALAVQRGLGWMLRSRTGATQKHSALQLAAAMTELLGPRWVLHQQLSAPPSSAKSAPSQEVPFLCVLAEILHVECSLLLHDALHAQAPVWGQAPGHRGETRDTWQPPQPSSGLVQELEERAQASMDTDCPEGAAPQLPPGEAELMSCANERPLHEHALRYAAQQAQHAATAAAPGVSQGTHEAASNQDHGSKPPADKMDQAQTAGGRAAHMLPVVLGLVEAVVEALACDAAAADAAAEDGGMEVEVEGCVSAAVAQQVMAALERIIAEVVAFLEVVAELQQQEEGVPSNGAVIRDEGLCVRQQQQQPGGQGANGTSMQEAFEVASQQKPPSAMQLVEGVCVPASMQPQLPATELVLACVRVVGRFLADVPDGHTPAMRHAMPFMLCVGSHSTPPTPALMSDGGQARDASQEGLGMWADREGTAVRFLLPGLLQATSTLSPEALELRTHITSSPPALASLVTTLCAACQHAAALAPILQGLPPAPPAPAARQPAPSKQNGPPTHPPSARKGGADTHQAPKTEQLLEGLAAAEQLLADVAMLLINLVDPTQAAPGAAAAQEGLLLGDSPQPSRSTAATCSEPGLGQTSPSGLTLGAATRALLPGLRSLGEWAELRNLPKLLSGADARGSFEGDELLPPDHAVALLSCMRLKPRALLCGGYLSGLVLHAAALQAGRSAGLQANSNEAPSGNMAVLTVLLQEGLFGEAPRGKGVDAMDWEGSAEEGIAAVQHTVQSASALLAAALKLGTSLVCGLVVEEASPGACVARAEASSSAATEHKGKGGLSGSGLGGRLRGLATLHAQLPALQADSVLADMSGDGEVCWERTAELIAHHPSLVCSFALEHSNNSSSSSSSSNERGVAQAQWTLAKWLGQLQRVQAGGGGSSGAAFREVLAQSLGLRLLLTTLRA